MPFSMISDDEFEILLSGVSEELYRIKKVCASMKFDICEEMRLNKFNFDREINPDANYFND